jgi:hypothetical protein
VEKISVTNRYEKFNQKNITVDSFGISFNGFPDIIEQNSGPWNLYCRTRQE